MPSRPSRWVLTTAALALLPAFPTRAAEGAGGATTAAAAAASLAAPAIDPSTLLLFSVQLDDVTLTDGLTAYGDAQDPLLPMGELTRLLEADVDVYPREGRITGNVGEARRSLIVDLASGTARIGGQEVKLAPQDVAVGPTEIYLRGSAVQKLLPLKLQIDSAELAIHMTALEKFPVQARLARMANRLDGTQTAVNTEAPLKAPSPYAWVSPPSLDAVIETGLQSTTPRLPFRYDLRAAADLGGANLQAYLSSDESGAPSAARVLLERRSLSGDLLGPLHARIVDLGDTTSPTLALGPHGVAGRGVYVSTVPLDQTNVFNRLDFRGELPPGYDAELYVNDVLRGSTNQSVNGRYEFLGVPLTPGVNVVRIVTYGPRGERAEEVRVINVGGGLLHKGEATLEFGAVQQDEPLFSLGTLSTSPFAGTELAAPGGVRVVGAVNYGLTDLLTLSAGAAYMPRSIFSPEAGLAAATSATTTDASTGLAAGLTTTPTTSTPTPSDQTIRRDGGVGVFDLGLRTSLFGISTQADVAGDSRGGTAGSLAMAGAWHGVSAVLRHAEYGGGFVDENDVGVNSALSVQRRTELTLDSNLKLRGRIVPVSLRVFQDNYADGSSDVQAAAQASSSISSFLFSVGLQYEEQRYRPAEASQTLSGYLTTSTYAAYQWQLRATLDYEILPTFHWDTLAVTADRRLSDLWSVRVAVGEPLSHLSGVNLLLGAVMQTDWGDLSFTGQYDNLAHDWRFVTQWNFGLGYDPFARGYRLTRSGPGSGGSAVVDAYLDENGNGVRDPGEQPVPNLEIQGGGGHRIVTDAQGHAYVTGLGAGPSTTLNVSVDKIDNPSVATPGAVVQLEPRPGGVTRINYPLRPTGDVTVKLQLVRDDGRKVGLSAARVELVPEKGAPIEMITEFDGSAIFNSVPVGTYHLELDPRQAKQLRMHLLSDATIRIKGDGSSAPDVTADVKFDPAPPEPAQTVAGATSSAPASGATSP